MVTRPSSSSRISSYSAVPIACATPPSIWPRTARVEHRAGVGGLDGLQDPHLAGRGVDGHPERVHVERDRARRAVLVAVAAVDAGRCGGDRVGERQPGPPEAHRVVLQRSFGLLACRGRRPRRGSARAGAGPRPARPPGDDRPGGAERAGVVVTVGVGLPDAIRSTVVPSAVATSWPCTVVVPLPNSVVPTATP